MYGSETVKVTLEFDRKVIDSMYDKFGTNGVSNKITSIKYSIENETAQNVSASLSSLAYSSQSSTNHTQKFSITNAPIFRDSAGTQGFDTTKTYNITVVVTDTSGNTATISGIIKDGKFAMIKGRDNNGDYHTGVNGLPDNNYAFKIHGDISADNYYPIGSVYISATNTKTPAQLFGGTWEQLQDVFLVCAGSTYSAGSTGGSATHTITSAELPRHTHSFSATTSGNGGHNHNLSMNSSSVAKGSNYARPRAYGETTEYGYTTSWVDNHTHTVSGTTGDGSFANNSFSLLPPYKAVYAWVRTG